MTYATLFIKGVPPILFTLFIGPWSDRFGRKLLMVLPMTGYIFYNAWFLANVIACTQADLAASVATLGASTYARREDCQPSSPVRMLAVHGSRDVTVPFAGGTIPGGDFIPAWVPGADEVAARWGAYNGCSNKPSLTTGEPLRGAGRLRMYEVEVTAYPGCEAGGASELWAVQGAQHLTQYSSVATQRILEFLLADGGAGGREAQGGGDGEAADAEGG